MKAKDTLEAAFIGDAEVMDQIHNKVDSGECTR